MPWNLPNLGLALALVTGALVLPAAASGELMGSVTGALDANADDVDADVAGKATGSVSASVDELTAKVEGLQGEATSHLDGLVADAEGLTGDMTGSAHGVVSANADAGDAGGSARTGAKVTDQKVNANNHLVLQNEDDRAANRLGVSAEPDLEDPKVAASEQMNLGTEDASGSLAGSLNIGG